jgi:hypothetical protein
MACNITRGSNVHADARKRIPSTEAGGLQAPHTLLPLLVETRHPPMVGAVAPHISHATKPATANPHEVSWRTARGLALESVFTRASAGLRFATEGQAGACSALANTDATTDHERTRAGPGAALVVWHERERAARSAMQSRTCLHDARLGTRSASAPRSRSCPSGAAVSRPTGTIGHRAKQRRARASERPPALLESDRGSHPEHVGGIRARSQRQVSRLDSRETRKSPEAGAETPALLLSTSISLPPGSVETAALRQEQAPAPVSVSWLRVVQQTHRVLAHDGIPAIELTIWRSRWPGRSPQLRRPRDDPLRRGAITRCRQPGRSLWLSGRRSWHDCIGDQAHVRVRAVLAGEEQKQDAAGQMAAYSRYSSSGVCLRARTSRRLDPPGTAERNAGRIELAVWFVLELVVGV